MGVVNRYTAGAVLGGFLSFEVGEPVAHLLIPETEAEPTTSTEFVLAFDPFEDLRGPHADTQTIDPAIEVVIDDGNQEFTWPFG